MLARIVIVVALVGCKEHKDAPLTKAEPKPAAGDAAVADATTAPKSLAEELEAIRVEQKLPAIAAAVWRDGKLVEMEAVGVRSMGDPTNKVTTKDYWHLGSNTKAMTAMLIGIHVDRGTLNWDDTLDKFFKKIDPGYAKVTIDQLIRHEGGAPSEPPADLWKQLWVDGYKPDARATFVQGILATPPAQKPGTFAYSNTGYMIAGVVLEKATGKRWEDLMRSELFGKLGMTSCGFGAPGRPGVTDPGSPTSGTESTAVVDQPWGHDAGGTPIPPGRAADNPPGLGPAGTVHCSLEDYGKFLAVHSTGQPAIVKPETLQHLQTPRDRYAGGWMVIKTPRGTVLGHSGSNTLWYVTATVGLSSKADERWTFVMATNSGSDAIERVFDRLVTRHVRLR